MGITCEDFPGLDYEPTDEDLVCILRIDPATGMSTEAAASRVTSESSNGTWVVLQTGVDFTGMDMTTFGIDGGLIRVAYLAGLFGPGNIPQMLSCIIGNIMGMKAIDAIRLLNCKWPESAVSTHLGPLYGSLVREEMFGVTDRPITATVPKPKVGLSTVVCVQVGYDARVGDVDLLKDDENLAGQASSPFSDCLTELLSLRDDAKNETGKKKSYLINVTVDTQTMLDRADEVAAQGGEYVTVDIVTAGQVGFQAVRECAEEHDLATRTHYAMHAASNRLPAHGVSMRVFTQVSRLCSADQLHTGTTGLDKLANEDTAGINKWLADDLRGAIDMLPTALGDLHPGLFPGLLNATGMNVRIQLGGGIHGHPDGTRTGTVVLRSATDTYIEGRAITGAAEETPELVVTPGKWGTKAPRQARRNDAASSRSWLLLFCDNGSKRVE